MSLIDNDSCLCVNSTLDLFSVPPTNTTSDKSFYSKTYPINTLSQGGPIEFAIKSNKQDYIYLGDSFIQLTLKILKTDGTAPAAPAPQAAIPDDSKVFPVNYLPAALFKDVQVHIDNKLIAGCNNLYPYKSFIEFILSYQTPVLETFGAICGFHKDNRSFNEVTTFDAAHNTGAKKRFEATQYGKSFQMYSKIHNDLFAQGKYFPGDIDMKIKFLRNESVFALMAHEDSDYKISIEDAILYVKRSTLHETFLNELAQFRSNQKFMKYPFKRCEVKYSTQSPNKSILQENRLISNDELPKRIILGLVDSRGFDGHLKHNPFYFQNFNVTDIVLQKGEDVTPFHEMKLDYENDKYYEAYVSLLYGTGRLFRNEALSITPAEFKNGFCLYCFDLSKSGPNSGTFELNESGTIHVTATLKTPVNHAIVMVFYLEYDSMLSVGPVNQPEVVGNL